MPDVFEIADVLVSHARRAHGEEIAIVAYYGSYAKGTASPTSDLDIFYIPDEGKALSLCTSFVLDGLPYDFWPVSWRMAKEIAHARSRRPWAVSASLIADAKVLYHRSPADLARFEALQAHIAELTQPHSGQEMVARALEAFKEPFFQLGQMRLALAADDEPGLRWAGRKFLHGAVNCLALVNQTYFSKGWGANWPQVLALPQRPADLDGAARTIWSSPDLDRVLAQADRLAGEVRAILRAAQASLAEPGDAQELFRDFYFFVFEYKHKVLSACQRGDEVAAGSAAFHLQEQICQFMSKLANGFYGTDFNLLGEYVGPYQEAGFPDLLQPATRGDLVGLAERVQELDERTRAWFRRRGIDLGILDSPEDLRRFLQQRDPASADPK